MERVEELPRGALVKGPAWAKSVGAALLEAHDGETAMSYLLERAKSFYHAGAGIARLVREERNARIHLLATVAVGVAGAWMRLSSGEWCLVILSIALVWAAEAVNSAIERVCDVVSREHHPMIGAAKDLAASAVLIVAIGALLVGVILAWTHLV